MTRVLLWDIDGTLLTTGRAGLIAWERALADITGSTSFPDVRPDGLTDHQIGAWLLEHSGARGWAAAHEAGLVDRLVAQYERHLLDALPLRQGAVLAHVEPILRWLRDDRPDILSWLLTGNTAAGGAAKLRHYRLDAYFPGGAFSERVEPRAEIARRAWARALEVCTDLKPGEVVVIGDTPHDIVCAQAIGARALAVASHVHSSEELAAHHPWMVVDRLPLVEDFRALLFPPTSP